MSDRAAFVQALARNPADLTARLVFADWLDDHAEGDRDRATAEYLRLCSDPVKGPKGTKVLPARVYKWLCSNLYQRGNDRRIGFPLPGAPAIRAEPGWSWPDLRPTAGEEITAPEVCNWHRLVPSVLALDVWGQLHEVERQHIERRGYRPTPRFWRDGQSVLVRLTLPGDDPRDLFLRTRPQLRLRFSTRFLVEANATCRRSSWGAIAKALATDLPFANQLLGTGANRE